MSRLQFNQIYPYQSMPVLAKDFNRPLPKRAGFFCHPFKSAAQSGVYGFSPMDFSFKLSDSRIIIRVPKENGSQHILTVERKQVSNNNFVLLSDIHPQRSAECLSAYRQRIPDSRVPEGFNKQEFGFFEVLLNVIVEEGPFDCYLQLWLGGGMELKPDGPMHNPALSDSPAQPETGKVWVKHPSNILHDGGFLCLDGEIDTQLWQGWFAIVLKPTRINQWVTIRRDMPVCQILSCSDTIQALDTIPFDSISQNALMSPIQWHLFDGDYGTPAGKYQRQIRGKP